MGNLFFVKKIYKNAMFFFLGGGCFLAASILIQSLSNLRANVDETFVNTLDEKKNYKQLFIA